MFQNCVLSLCYDDEKNDKTNEASCLEINKITLFDRKFQFCDVIRWEISMNIIHTAITSIH
jgi:hypothetical protein